jgi:PKD repeat protein
MTKLLMSLLFLIAVPNFALASSLGFWITPKAEEVQELSKANGETIKLSGNICSLVGKLAERGRCMPINDRTTKIYAFFPDEVHDVSDSIEIIKGRAEWSYSFTSGPLLKEDLNIFTLIVGNISREVQSLLRTKASFTRRLQSVERRIESLRPSRTYEERLAYLLDYKSTLIQTIISIDEAIDRDPEVLARYSRPIQVDGKIGGEIYYSSIFDGHKFTLKSKAGIAFDEEKAVIEASFISGKTTRIVSSRNNQNLVSLSLNGNKISEKVLENQTEGKEYKLDSEVTLHSSESNTVELRSPEGLIKLALLVAPKSKLPIASLKSNKAKVAIGESVIFDGESSREGSNGFSSFRLEFGDGYEVSGNDKVWTHAYTKPGIYTATLTVVDNASNVNKSSLQIEVLPVANGIGPVANFTYLLDSESGELITFYQGREGDSKIVKAYYTLKNGTELHLPEILWRSSLSIPIASPFEIDLTLTVVDELGKTSTKTHHVSNVSRPILSLYTKDLGFRKVLFDLRDSFDSKELFLGDIEIDYGDGFIEIFDTPTRLALHTYSTSGIYTVKLKAESSNGTVSTKEFQVEVSDLILSPFPPMASFMFEIEEDLPHVSFYIDQSMALNGNIVSTVWDYGDGTSYSGNEKHHIHFYEPGTYLVKLTVTDSNGLQSFQTQRVTVHASGAPLIAAVYCEQTEDVGQVSCEFDAIDKFKEISEVIIDWGDNTVESLIVSNNEIIFFENQQHTYSLDGTYEMTLTVKTSRGDTVTAKNYVTISDTGRSIPPVATFNCYTDQLTVHCDGSFSYDPDGFITSYEWDWGDGNIYNGYANTSYTYKSPGDYLVKLKLVDNTGETSTHSQLVTTFFVGEPPVISAKCTSEAPFQVNCSLEAVSNNGEIKEFSWKLPDGTVLYGKSIAHSFTSAGNKYIEARAIDKFNQVGIAYVHVDVMGEAPKPIAGMHCFQQKALELICDGYTSTIESGVIAKYVWSVNGVENSQGARTTIKLNSEGTFEIGLTVISSFSKVDSINKTFEIAKDLSPDTSKGIFQARQNFSNQYYPLNPELHFDLVGTNIKYVLNPDISEMEPEVLSIRLNDFRLPSEAYKLEGKLLTIYPMLIDGENNIEIESLDENDLPIYSSFALYAGSRNINLIINNLSNNDSVDLTYKLPGKENSPTVNVSTKEQEITLLNIPRDDVYIFGDTVLNKTGIVRLDSSINDGEMFLKGYTAASLENNDFSDGLTGWDMLKGNASIVDHVQASYEEEGQYGPKNLRIFPNHDGEVEFIKAIAPENGANAVTFRYRFNGSNEKDFYNIVLKTKLSKRVIFESQSLSDALSQPSEGSGKTTWISKTIMVDGPNDHVEIYYYSKHHGTAIVLNRISQSKATLASAAITPDDIEISKFSSQEIFIRNLKLTDKRMYNDLKTLSLGYFHPYDGFSIQDANGQRTGVNDLYLHDIVLTDPNTYFTQFKLKIIDADSNELIGTIDYNEGSKKLIDQSKRFTVISGDFSHKKLAFRILSRTVYSARLIKLKIFASNGINSQDFDIPRTYIGLKSMKEHFGFEDYDSFRFGRTKDSRDENQGGDDYVSLEATDYFMKFFTNTYQQGNANYKAVFNDISILNGGPFRYINGTREKSHQVGSNIDLNFMNLETNSLVYNKGSEQSTMSDFKIIQELALPSVEKIFGNFKIVDDLIKKRSLSELKDFSREVYSSCLDDGRLASDVIKPLLGHDDHLHIQLNLGLPGRIIEKRIEDLPPSDSVETRPHLLERPDTLGTYDILNTDPDTTYRWLFHGDPNLIENTEFSKLYPIEMLAGKVDISDKVIRVGKGGRYVQLAAIGYNKSRGCMKYSKIEVKTPYDVRGLPTTNNNGFSSLLFFKPSCEEIFGKTLLSRNDSFPRALTIHSLSEIVFWSGGYYPVTNIEYANSGSVIIGDLALNDSFGKMTIAFGGNCGPYVVTPKNRSYYYVFQGGSN